MHHKQIQIKVIPNAKLNSIKQEGEIFKVYVNAPAIDGKANKAVVKLLADYFKVKIRDINLLKGEKNQHKIIEIANLNTFPL